MSTDVALALRIDYPERFTFDELHRDEDRACVLIETVNRGDVCVIQCGEELCFALEAREAVFVVGERRGQRLDCDFAAELHVRRSIDFAHAACPDPIGERVRSQNLSGVESHSRPLLFRPVA
jgi:hypothetical protein